MDMTSDIVSNIVRTGYGDIPARVIEITKKFIMDTIGVGLAGIKAPGCREMLQLFKYIGGVRESTVMGYGYKLPSLSAAFLNSMFSHALDYDDTLDDSAMHSYASVLPAALALAEVKGNVSGRELIEAVVLGVDLSVRLGCAIKTPLSWIRTATCGSFGAAAAASKIMGLSETKTHNALGIVYSQTSGNAQCLIDGGLTKRMQPAFSARAGVLSALMADRGISGAKDVFEGKYGFFYLYERGFYDREVCLEDLGKKFGSELLSIKPYPSCRMTHAAIDAALKLRSSNDFSVDEITKVEAYVSKMVKSMVGRVFSVRENPQVDAQFSIPYTVAVSLEKGKIDLYDFEEDVVRKRRDHSLIKRVIVLENDSFDERDIKRAVVRVHLKNGAVFSEETRVPKGHPDNPLDWDECIGKFRNCVHYGGCETRSIWIEELIDTLVRLEQIRDVSQLTRLISCSVRDD
ncbi:MAG: MmgE/PrpD family protein [Synergistetes bacterium]|nr:MmgE/PrpD family protein [Synergistota bacterium]